MAEPKPVSSLVVTLDGCTAIITGEAEEERGEIFLRIRFVGGRPKIDTICQVLVAIAASYLRGMSIVEKSSGVRIVGLS